MWHVKCVSRPKCNFLHPSSTLLYPLPLFGVFSIFIWPHTTINTSILHNADGIGRRSNASLLVQWRRCKKVLVNTGLGRFFSKRIQVEQLSNRHTPSDIKYVYVSWDVFYFISWMKMRRTYPPRKTESVVANNSKVEIKSNTTLHSSFIKVA